MMKDNFQFLGIPQRDEMFCRRLRLEIKFVLPSLYKAENGLCCHQHHLEKADIIESLDPKHCNILLLIRKPTFCISKRVNLTMKQSIIYRESLYMIPFLVC